MAEPATGCQASSAEGDDSFEKSSWVIAVGLAVVAAVSNNVGVNLQKLAWSKKQSGNVSQTVYRSYWMLGMTCIILASVFDFSALGFGPQSVIAPIGSLTMVANACVAPAMLGEKLRKSVLWSTLVIMCGCVLSVYSASHVNIICDVEALLSLYWTRRFTMYFIFIVCSILLVLNFIARCEEVERELGVDSPAYRALYSYHRISYALLSGIFGAQSVLFARSFNELLISSMRGGRFFLTFPGTYVIFGSLAGTIAAQIYWLNIGLARFESLYNVPVFTAVWIVGTVLGGGVFYGEFSDFTVQQAILFPLGIVMCICGVFMLVWKREGKSAAPPTSTLGGSSDAGRESNVSASLLRGGDDEEG